MLPFSAAAAAGFICVQLFMSLSTSTQSEVWQSTGHGSSLQGTVLELGPHRVPPCCDLRLGARCQYSLPRPHVLVHPAAPPGCFFHGPITQSMGHGTPVLQSSVSTRSDAGQSPPLCCASTSLSRERVLVPLPQSVSLLHLPKLLHGPSTQATGHGPVVHAFESETTSSSSQPFPPNAADTFLTRVRICLPGPHSAVQLPYAVHAPISQSTGHGSALHDAFLVSAGQALPLKAGLMVMLRNISIVPPPHSLSHSLSRHIETLQSTGHFCTLHLTISSRTGQVLPPFSVS